MVSGTILIFEELFELTFGPQVIQYTIKLIVPFLRLKARLQHRAGLRSKPISPVADSFAKFDNLLGDSRTLWRFGG
jgi:hypothetical protein